MEERKYRRVHKLSDAIPSAALYITKERLQFLRQFIADSAEIGEKVGQVVAGLRKTAAPEEEPFVFVSDLKQNEQLLRVVFRNCDDLIFRSLEIGRHKALLVYGHGMTDEAGLAETVIKPLLESNEAIPPAEADVRRYIHKVIHAAGIQFIEQPSEVLAEVLGGKTLFLIDGHAQAVIVGATQFAKRNIGDGKTEGVIRGAHEAFNETLIDNISLIRRRVRDPDLKIKFLNVGVRSATRVALLYVGDLVKPGLMEEVEKRISAVSTDVVLASYKIEELISDHPWSPFPQAELAERPDSLINALYGGRVGIIVDGTPMSFLVPGTYGSMMQAVDDYTTQPVGAILMRLTRHLSAFFAIYLPGVYISIVSFHPGMLPTTLAISIAELRARTPFPSIIEVIAMIVILEIFQEAIVRLPEKMVTAASVVGGFVIGTTVVEAGLINPLLVVTMAMTAIASYTVSYNLSISLRILRTFIVLMASVLGLYGVMLGLLFLVVHACALRSFGESYVGGIFDITLLEDWKDELVRFPMQLNRTRGKMYGPQERTKAGDNDG
jgi:spore germination protein KA/spore germination protein